MRVLVGLSGGVDSAIAAYLLKEQGYDVSCAFMRNWDSLMNNDIFGNPTLSEEICSQEKDYNDAKSVADALGLKLYRIDFIEEYWNLVFNKFLDEYKLGRTPNPDILCNKYIKFDSFFDYAMKLGFDKVATGHYAKIDYLNGSVVMKKASDLNKDQSYFLCQISRSILDKIIFPLQDIDKGEVRRIADKLNLDIAKKKDSTGICFIGERNFRQFLSNYLPMKEGNIINVDTKEVVGKHGGVLYYTIGQRKGLNIGGALGPYFVCSKDVYKNELYVSNVNNIDYLYSDSCLVNNMNYLFDVENKIECFAKFRYRQKDVRVTLEKISDSEVMVYYPEKVKAVTCGQEAVFYLDDIVIGGGVIDKVFKDGVDIFEMIKDKVNS